MTDSSYTASPKIGFPHRTKWLKKPIGWKDYGKVKDHIPSYFLGNPNKCVDCLGDLYFGLDYDGILFKYCPHCMKKV